MLGPLSIHTITRLLDDLHTELGDGGARAEPLELALYARDAGVQSGSASAVCFPATRTRSRACVRTAAATRRPVLSRGNGTGLAGGATPIDEPLVIITTRMNRVLSVDPAAQTAAVEPGVLNLDLSRSVASLGLHYRARPVVRAACTIGGNVATNAGGPHCLVRRHERELLAIDVVLADGTKSRLGGDGPDTPGYDLRGVFVGSEGTMGIATAVTVRLLPRPPMVRTLLCDFTSIDDAAATVSGIIAAGLVPAALEMMDAEITRAVEDFVGAGFPRDAAAVLLVEVDGLEGGVAAEVDVVDPRRAWARGAHRAGGA